MVEIRGVVETSFLDWDGKVVSVLLTSPCNFRCPFCHNWEIVTQPDRFPEIPRDRILERMEEHRDFLDGACITGGEPTLFNDLADFAMKLKEREFRVKLDTNGSRPEIVKEMLDRGVLDYVAMDVKAPLERDRYAAAAGTDVDLDKIRESIQLVKGMDEYEFRTTLCPGLVEPADVPVIARELKGAKKYVVQQFNPANAWDERLRAMPPFAKTDIETAVEKAREFVQNVKARGILE